MKYLLGAVFLAVSLFSVGSAAAETGDYAEGSNAREYGLQEEEKATFSGKVVDVMCELSGDCASNCGGGSRIMGIVREDDGKLVLVLKNAQFQFNGAVPDLLPFCNREVDVDGLLVGDGEFYGAKFYMLQFIRETGNDKWTKANAWKKSWKLKNPEIANRKGPWFRRDPRVVRQIEANGYFGLGKAVDEQYRKKNQ